MTTGYVLILAVLILGGVIATLGDRIGMRVGKARLSLFRLRPRQTATVVSILTGSVISASTLALLFGVSRQLRTGVFELEQIQADLAQARTDLQEAQAESAAIENALTNARQRQQEAQQDLQDINESLQQAVEEQQSTQNQLQQTQNQLTQLRSQLGNVSQQAEQLRGEIQRLESERTELSRQRDAVQGQLAERDERIAARDREIAQREQTLSQLEAQQALLQADVASLESQVTDLENQAADFRAGNVVVSRNQRLAWRVVQVSDGQEAREVIDRLLAESNRRVIQAIAPGASLDRQVILISQEEVARLVNRIRDQQEYVVRVLSNANYITGEPCVIADAGPCVQVYIDAAVNEIIYDSNERLATVTVDPRTLTNQGLVDQLDRLIASLQFRAVQDGIVGDTLQIANGRTDALIAFLNEIRARRETVEIQAITAEPTFTTGPLRVELLAVSNGEVLTRTDELPRAVELEEDSESESEEDPNLAE